MSTVYTHEQVGQFLEHINIPGKYRLESNPALDYGFLKALHIHMITAIPYENLALHYSEQRKISIDPQVVFQKIVGDARGRGGYCVENSLLYLHMLRAIGFRVFPVGVKIRYRQDGVPKGDYAGWYVRRFKEDSRARWKGAAVLVERDVPDQAQRPVAGPHRRRAEASNGSRWTCDVAFGGDGPTEPIELREGAAIKNLKSQDARLIRDWIPSQTERTEERKFWIYQCRNGQEQPWNAFYAFHEGVEWSLPDYEITNWFTGHNPYSFQTYTAIVVKFLRRQKEGAIGDDDDDAEEVYGKRMLVNEAIKENLGGKTQVVLRCRTEEERVKGLRDWFGIELTEEQAASIKGFQTEVKSKP